MIKKVDLQKYHSLKKEVNFSMKNMKQLFIVIALVAIVVSPSFAGRTYDFNYSLDTRSWYAIHESGLPSGTYTMSWNSTAGINGTGCIQLVINKTDGGVIEKYDVNISTWNNVLSASMTGPTYPQLPTDTTWGVKVRCTTEPVTTTFYTQAYVKDNSWTWHDVTLPGHSGGTFNLSTSWQHCYVRVTAGTPMSYTELGVQILIGSATTYGDFTILIDDARLWPSQETTDWNWQINTRSNTIPWHTTAGNNGRGLSYNPATDHVLFSTTDGGTQIMVRNASDGSAPDTIQRMNTTGVTGGTTALTKVRTTSDGVIYGCNLTINDTTDNFIIYRWANEGASVTTTYKNRAATAVTFTADSVGPKMPGHATGAYRIGDGMDVVMSGSTVDFYLGRSDAAVQNSVYKFRSINGGLSIDTIIAITLVGGTGTAYRGTGVDGFDGDIYNFSNAASNMASWTNDGVTRTSLPVSINGNQLGASHPRVRSLFGRKYVGYVDPISAFGGTFRRGCVADITNGSALAGVVGFTDPESNATYTNGNATGDFDIDTARNRFLFLVTNNFIGTYPLSAGTTKTWTGAAGNDRWANPANWSPVGVPDGTDNVVLDNSNTTGAYLVTIDQITVRSCRTLTLGDAVSGSAITLDIANAALISLNVAGTQSVNTSILIRNGGRLQNRSTAASGDVIQNRNGGNMFQVLNGGYAMHSTARSFSTPFPTSGDGAIAFDSGATMDFWLGSAAVTMNGRTYGNLMLNSNSGAAVTMTGAGASPAVIMNDLTIGPNVTFAPAMTGIFAIQGNINNNGVAAALSCTSSEGLALNGSAGQSILGTGTTLFIGTGITLDNAAGLTIGNPNVYVNSTLFMKSGNITTGANTLTIGTSAGAVGALIRTSGTVIGNLQRWIPASVATTAFPIGTATSYNEAQVAFTSAPATGGTLLGTFIPTFPAGSTLTYSPVNDGGLVLNNIVPGGYWSISSANGLSGGTYDLTLNADQLNITVGIDSVRIIKRADGASPWTLDGSAGTNSGISIVRTGMSGFSDFSLGGPVEQVPVELSRFDAILEPRD
jgi:hypothetical protein